MKLDIVKNSSNTYYYVANSVRKGNKIITKRIKKLGDYNSLLNDGHKEPLAQAKILFDEFVNENKLSLDISINFQDDLERSNNNYSESTYKNIGCAYLDDIYNALKIDSFFNAKYKEDKSKYKYDLNSIIKLLVFSRILSPGSKLRNHRIKDNFIINTDKIELQHIYRALDTIYDNRDEMQYEVFKSSNKIIDRKFQVMYFDCTNYYFETREEDEDIINENNEIEFGLRKYGLSKQHQPKPLVQCGLYVDEEGIPVFLDVQPGNTSEKKMALPSENKIMKNLNLETLIYCADAGLNTCEIKANNVGYKKAYILTESLKVLNEEETNILLNELNWEIHSFDEDVDNNLKKEIKLKLKRISKDKFIEAINKQNQNLPLTEEEKLYVKIKKIRKSYTTPRLIKITNIYNKQTKELKKEYKMLTYKTEEGLNKAISEAERYMSNVDESKYNKQNQLITYQILEEKLINTFDKTYYFYSKNILDNQIERAKQNIEKNKYFINSNNNDPKRFIKPSSINKEGEKIQTELLLDENKIKEEKRYLGYYLISTSLTDSDEKEVVRINSKRWKIEERFRITKTYFNSRPVYLSTKERIQAHFYICYLALTILCILEKIMNSNGSKYKIEDIIQTLNNMKIQEVDNIFYLSLYKSSATLDRLEEIFNFGFNKKKYLPKLINKFKNRKSSNLLKKEEEKKE